MMETSSPRDYVIGADGSVSGDQKENFSSQVEIVG
jgi:hypothetical protein